MLKILKPIAYMSIVAASVFLIKTPSPENFHVKQTRESSRIYKIVKNAEKELYSKLAKSYVPQSYLLRNDTLTINYAKSMFNDHSAHCGVASGILKKILEEDGLETEYVILRGRSAQEEDFKPMFAANPKYRGIETAHVFLKAGNVYIDPTWWQFFDDADKVKDRIAVGTKEHLHEYFLHFNDTAVARFYRKEDRMKNYFSRFRSPNQIDPNFMLDFAAALYAENSRDTVRFPFIYIQEIDAFTLQNLDFFREKTINMPGNIKHLEEVFLNTTPDSIN